MKRQDKIEEYTRIYSGKKYNRLTLICCVSLTKGARFQCKCECGTIKIIAFNEVRLGRTVSCGCARIKSMNYKRKGNKLYWVWMSIKTRCLNPKSSWYSHYGGRGISICEEWKNDFCLFHDWCLLNNWQEGLEIDRIDNNGNYEPNNCRVVTRRVNANNKRTSVFVTYKGERKTLKEWTDVYSINYNTFFSRYMRLGWSFEKALETPSHTRKYNIRSTLLLLLTLAFSQAKSQTVGGGASIGYSSRNAPTVELMTAVKLSKKINLYPVNIKAHLSRDIDKPGILESRLSYKIAGVEVYGGIGYHITNMDNAKIRQQYGGFKPGAGIIYRVGKIVLLGSVSGSIFSFQVGLFGF